ncbi:hypothetical protein M514_11978, partial [Trichuris suis]
MSSTRKLLPDAPFDNATVPLTVFKCATGGRSHMTFLLQGFPEAVVASIGEQLQMAITFQRDQNWSRGKMSSETVKRIFTCVSPLEGRILMKQLVKTGGDHGAWKAIFM